MVILLKIVERLNKKIDILIDKFYNVTMIKLLI